MHNHYVQLTVDTLLSTWQPGVVKEWDPPPSLPEPLVPVKYKDPGSAQPKSGSTSVVKKSSLEGRKQTMSKLTCVTEKKVMINVLLLTFGA